MDSNVLREFLAEAEDLLEVLFGDLQALRARHAEGRARRELVGRVFRHVHTIKGSSATVELETVTNLAHEFENLLDGIRLGRVPLDDAALDIFDVAANAISHSLGAVARSEQQPEVRPVLERLRQLASREAEDAVVVPPGLQKTLAALPAEVARALSRHEMHRLSEVVEEGAHLFVVIASFDLSTFDERFRDLSDALSEDGEIILTLPGTAGASPDQISFQIIYAAKATREELTARAGAFGQVSVTELLAEQSSAAGAPAAQATEDALRRGAETASIAPLTTHVRVELSKLDAIISAAHDLFAEAASALGGAQESAGPGVENPGGESSGRIRRAFVRLEEQLIGLRMVAAGQMIERAARAGRIAARATGKEVKFEMKGGDVRLDKAIADVIADPLLHILRNAVDHGVETPPERARVGKKPRGLVRLEAAQGAGGVLLRVTDDGRGVDPLRITRAAAAQGLIETGRLLTKQEALRLIFRPGFTTAAAVSKVSGRGVGLDVVERAVEKVGGELRVESEPGKGTVFEVLLPATLALLPALVVRSGGHRYCIDAGRVVGTVALAQASAGHDAETIDWQGSAVPAIAMRRLLGQSLSGTEEMDSAGAAAVIVSDAAASLGEAPGSNGAGRSAIVVDAVEGRTEALVRGLGRHAARWRPVSGAAELRDGTIALVLDLARLLETGR